MDNDANGGNSNLPTPSTPLTPMSSPSSSSSSFSESPPRMVRLLREIYERCRFTQVVEPTQFEETMQYKEWCDAMDDEIVALEKNQTWDLVDLAEGKEVVGLKWVYKINFLNPMAQY